MAERFNRGCRPRTGPTSAEQRGRGRPRPQTGRTFAEQRSRGRPRRESGQSLVEMAVSMTMILTLLAGVIDIGRIYYTYLALMDAAAEGAVYASIAPTDIAGIENRLRGEAPQGIVDWSHAIVTTTVIGDACRGGSVKVAAEVQQTLVTPLLGAILGSQTLPLKAEVVNTILSPSCP